MSDSEHPNHVIDTYGDQKLTIPSEVNSKTKVSELNLNWSEKDLRERERTKHVHRLHPYLGKFIPQLVEIFLRKYFQPGQTVIDPFSGSGTTLVQAQELGINSVGVDISEFNILISKVKTDSYDISLLTKEIHEILKRAAKLTGNIDKDLFYESKSTLDIKTHPSEFLNTWFAERALNELLTFKSLISDYHHQDILKIILSRSARSSRLTTHFDLDFPKKPQTEPYKCYKHGRVCTPTDEAFKFLKRYSLDTLKRVKIFDTLKTDSKVSLFNADSRNFDFPLADGVITSPPYVGLIDYHEQHRYAYELLNLKDQSKNEIGPASNGKSKKAKKEFEDDLVQVFRNVEKSIKKGGRLIIIAGDRDSIYKNIESKLDSFLETKIERHVNRRTGRRKGNFYETVFIFKKPQ